MISEKENGPHNRGGGKNGAKKLTLRPDNLLEPDHVRVLEPLEQLDLPDRRDWEPFALVVHAHALERHERAVADVAGEVDLAVRALADLPELLVAVLDAAAAAPLLVARRGGRELDAPVERGRCGRRGRGELLLVGVLLASSFFRSRAAAGRGRWGRGR